MKLSRLGRLFCRAVAQHTVANRIMGIISFTVVFSFPPERGCEMFCLRHLSSHRHNAYTCGDYTDSCMSNAVNKTRLKLCAKSSARPIQSWCPSVILLFDINIYFTFFSLISFILHVPCLLLLPVGLACVVKSLLCRPDCTAGIQYWERHQSCTGMCNACHVLFLYILCALIYMK